MRKILKQFTQRDAHPVIQFIKYGISGGVATAVDVLLFYFLAWKVLPALQESDPLVQLARSTLGVEFALTAVNETLRASRFILISGITFKKKHFAIRQFTSPNARGNGLIEDAKIKRQGNVRGKAMGYE